MIVLTVNTGSSSVRLATCLREPDGELRAGQSVRHDSHAGDARKQLAEFLHQLDQSPQLVAHRVVHGGDRFRLPCLIGPAVEAEIERLELLAPLHNPMALEWIRAAREACGDGVPQVAVFDTAFYAALPEAARRYAIPARIAAQHNLHRFGFHGIAHEAMWRRWRELRPDLREGGRLITFQLGSGCSVTATDRGQPIDTSMGFSPNEGLMMATRSGDLDPGLITHLQSAANLGPAETEEMLNRASGLQGVAGDSDMRRLLERSDEEARLAIEMYCRRARKYLGAYLALLGGADGIAFGGGVGENAPAIRARVLAGMAWAGIVVDERANGAIAGTEGRLTSPKSNTEVWVIPVDEAAVLARAAIAVVGGDPQAEGAP